MLNNEKFEEILSQVRKPGRYIGNEWNVVKKDLKRVSVKFALSFPDLYEIGMSHLGYKLIYHILNEREDIACERVFLPDVDLEAILRKESLPLFTLESKEELRSFDIIGFTLAYELNYTNVLNILDLAGIPLIAKERGIDFPLIIAGGPSSFNPEPMSDFVDAFVIGEAEEAVFELIEEFKGFKRDTGSSNEKAGLLKRIAKLDGVYVPALYSAEYNDDGTLISLRPVYEEVPTVIKKRRIADLDRSFYPTRQIVPYVSIVHDRASIEIMRGCPHSCRFCQARNVYHHKRERSAGEVIRLAEETVSQTGYEEVSLLSLSSGNHTEIIKIITTLIDRFQKRGISVSLPSLRIEEVLKDLPRILSKIKKSGLTFAPEAGSERLRFVVNKKTDFDQLKAAVDAACKAGWDRVKLYFMIGLPTETDKDIDDMVDAIYDILKIHKRIQVNVSINAFIPKSHTPFQWMRMTGDEDLKNKISYIREKIKTRRAKLKFHDTRLSILEGVFSLGDRRLGRVLLRAFEKGCRHDGWIEHLNFSAWMDAFNEEGVDHRFYIYREKDLDEILPWSHIDCGMTQEFLKKEARCV